MPDTVVLSDCAITIELSAECRRASARYLPALPGPFVGLLLIFSAMANPGIEYQEVPAYGPLQLGAVYRRQHLNNRFGGNRMTGIVPSPKEPVVLLFHTEEPSQQFYSDGFDGSGIYWYSGRGTNGDMQWTHENRAIRYHAEHDRDLFLFERVQRKDGLWRFSHVVSYLSFKIERRPGQDGNDRNALVFALLPIESDGGGDHAAVQHRPSTDLRTLRAQLLSDIDSDFPSVQEKAVKVYARSAQVIEYALARAAGICEACRSDAPFKTIDGSPFLEVHHLHRLADGGPDRIDRVAAICPNCHRRCHYSEDANEFNCVLAQDILAIEEAISTKP